MNNYNDNFLNLLKHPLDKYQSNALRASSNSVIAAGAGSGKTQVLATRFAWLIMTEQAKADEILTLTFTNKAASEMYQRIYETLLMFSTAELSENLSQTQQNLAKQALEDFSSTHIQTLDSYCSSIVRQCANRYGIKPDFSVGSADCERNVKDKAFIYILQNAGNLAIQTFVKPGKLQTFAENIFSNIILKFTSLATADNFFTSKLDIQKRTIIQAWNDLFLSKKEGSFTYYLDIVSKGVTEYKKKAPSKPNPAHELYLQKIAQLTTASQTIENYAPLTINDIENPSEELKKNIKFIENFLKLIQSIPAKSGFIQSIRPLVKPLKENVDFYNSVLVYIKQYKAIQAFNYLLEDFLKQVNTSKRESGNLSFVDISELALKILLENEDIRNQEKSAYKKIMIDEFQDNNSKNRDLLYLLSLKKGEFEQNGECVITIPEKSSIHDLIIIKNENNQIIEDKREPNKLFFVGDEKQSIYKFRGADVSVFNELTKDNENTLIPMTYNYRSANVLLKAFNVLFKNGNGIFADFETPEDKKDYEAYYTKEAEKNGEELRELTKDNIPIHALCLKTNELSKNTQNFIPEKDLLAYSIAKKIYEMGYAQGNWNDFAILDRSRTDRSVITKYLNFFGIPYNVDQQKNIFSDGIINDFYNFLRICVYPSDANAFAAYLCSPFAGLCEQSVQNIIAYLNHKIDNPQDLSFNPFEQIDEKLKKDIPLSEYEKYIKAVNFFKETKPLVLKQKITTTLSYLWNTKGYKYETMVNAQTLLNSEHFDMLFELARQSEENGKTVAWFIDQLDMLKSSFSLETADIDANDITYPLERSQSVNIMTIHKSKGLEFKHVFLYGCTAYKSKHDSSLYFYDDTYGVSIKPENGAENYFAYCQKEDAKVRELAEFRRLIYVGITRAVSDVYIICSYSNSDSSKKNQEKKSIFRLFEEIILSKYDSDFETTPFIENVGFDYIPILPITFEQLYSEKQKVTSAEKLRKNLMDNNSIIYEASKIISYTTNPISRSTPSSLEKSYIPEQALDSDSGQKYEISEDTLRSSNFTPADFGTLVHSYLEMQAKGLMPQEYEPSPKLFHNLSEKEICENKKICEQMCSLFRNSTLGKQFEDSKAQNLFYRAEWGFRMFYEGTIFTGSIDLIFEKTDGSIIIVDYKSDNQIDEEKYIEQQRCYKIAAQKLLNSVGKKISSEQIFCYLYFLKHDKTIELKV